MSAAIQELVPEIIDLGEASYAVNELLAATDINAAIAQMGISLADHYSQVFGNESSRQVQVVTVLKGAKWFSSDLQAAMSTADPNLVIHEDEVGISSYEGTESGELQFYTTVPNVSGNHVVIAEDILDTGATLDALVKALREQGPASLRVAVMLDKDTQRRKQNILGDTVVDSCFTIGDEFVIGRGLDLDGKYRKLSSIYALNQQ